ncbi:MAG: GAF domain-containing protein [Anaerolineae bacterium]|nr:GAF domain-containing protein [Anaerolineae bacterium]MDH7474251.1 adenylate/guanylate cyclase domain-containing protein [Anaerolineae bacterium]
MSHSTIEMVQQEITAFREGLSRLSGVLTKQRAALQQLLASSRGGGEKSLQDLLAFASSAATIAQQLEARLPQFNQELARLQDDLTARTKEHEQLSALYEVTRLINSTLDLEEVLKRVMDTIIELTGAERGFLMLIDDETGELEFKVAREMDRKTIDDSSFQISRTIVWQVARDGVPIVTTNAQADPRFRAQESVVSYSLRSILCVPLRVKDKITGVVYADNRIKHGLFGDRDRDLLVAFANQAAVAIENARLFESVVNAKKLMDNIFASIASGVITTDNMDKITLFNRAAEQILGIPAHSCLNAPYCSTLPVLGELLPPLVEEVKTKEKKYIRHEIESYLPTRGQVSLSMNLSPLKNAQDETLGVAVVVDDLTEKKRYERERAMIKRYLPPELIENLPENLEELQLGGSRRELTIFFSDIRGFTTYSEAHAPEQVVEMVNQYCELVHAAIRAHNGIVDKYEGDAVMAHFNSPLLEEPRHALQAVRAAWAIKQAVDAYHQQMPPESRLQLGIGINTGEVVAGNIGAEDHMEYTLIGDAVNLSKRLQENAKPGQILLGQNTYKLVKDYVLVNELEPIRVKGRAAAEQVYELIGLLPITQ